MPELQLQRYGLEENDKVNFLGILNNNSDDGTVRDAKDFLTKAYCGSVSIEFTYIESEYEREWLVENYENHITNSKLSNSTKREILELLIKSQTWDQFLATKYPSVKRYDFVNFFSMILLNVNNVLLTACTYS